MSNLFERPGSGWRYEANRPKGSHKQTLARLEEHLQKLASTEDGASAEVKERRNSALRLLTRQINNVSKISRKRPPRALRRANPKNLNILMKEMRRLCLTVANDRNLDRSKRYWFLKAEMASKLKVPEHFVSQVMHKWNLLGICDQGSNDGVHDTHRSKFWGGPWVSSWQDTRYTVQLDKLENLVI